MNRLIPHPREVFDYQGGEAVEATFLDALDRGRMHHAWLLVGPEGVGKATFAYRAARRLLGAAADPRFGPLGSAPDDPVSRQIMARAHPDLIVLQREQEDGKPRRSIPVDEARMLPDFFALSPASAPYRVAIVDAADDLNANAANAVLKTLEEPPERGVLLLVSHAPGALLATLRSRCRRLRFEPPPVEDALAWVAEKAGVDANKARRLVHIGGGAPGAAWRLSDAGALDLDATAREILGALPKLDEVAMLTLAEAFRGPAGAARFEILFNLLANQIHAMASGQAMTGEGDPGSLERWSEAWRMLVDLPREADAINLDRTDCFHAALAQLRAIA